MVTRAPVEYPPIQPRSMRPSACNARPTVSGQAHHSDRKAPIQLTPAQSQVLAFLPTHLTVEAIAERLGRSRSTVKTHIAHIYEKLGVAGRMEAVDRAWELGLLAEPGGHQTLVASLVVEQRSLPSSTTRTNRARKGR